MCLFASHFPPIAYIWIVCIYIHLCLLLLLFHSSFNVYIHNSYAHILFGVESVQCSVLKAMKIKYMPKHS